MKRQMQAGGRATFRSLQVTCKNNASISQPLQAAGLDCMPCLGQQWLFSRFCSWLPKEDQGANKVTTAVPTAGNLPNIASTDTLSWRGSDSQLSMSIEEQRHHIVAWRCWGRQQVVQCCGLVAGNPGSAAIL